MTGAPLNLNELREDVDTEAKLAVGRDGKGELPSSFWETYSAFANTDGGVVLLGVSEDNGVFQAVGLEEPDRVVQDLWNLLNNPGKVSSNLLTKASLRRLPTGNGRWVIEISIPRASRRERPVFINGNPLTGTFKRLHSGDCRCREDEVRQMMAEQVEDARDTKVLQGFDLDDLNMESVADYRNRLSAAKPAHPFLGSAMPDFLRKLGCCRKDRDIGIDGLTLAGLLMFGRQETILEAAPYYFLDYREIPLASTKTEWDDRLVPDGTWSGNLYDFYKMVILRLFRDLKVPFRLAREGRQDETPVHKALREALINAIIHADYSLRTPLLVIKAPDYFEFRNPGRMRVPLTEALEGGQSDCRNRTIQRMFSLIGMGEQAGSGIPRMLENWKSQHYRPPELIENVYPEYTTTRLRTLSLLPEFVRIELRERFGDSLDRLGENERLALATAMVEGYVSNGRLRQITKLHPRDITLLLSGLVADNMLDADGKGRGTTYRVKGVPPVDLKLDSNDPDVDANHRKPSDINEESTHNGEESTHNGKESTHNGKESTHKEDVHPNPSDDPRLIEIASEVRCKKRADINLMQDTLLELCRGIFLTPQQIGRLMNRSPQGVRERVIKPLLDKGLLERRFPNQPNHVNQAYRTKDPSHTRTSPS